MIRLNVSYPLALHPDLDAKIIKAAGVNDDGSGAGFGERDISFSFKTKKDRDAAKKRIIAVHKEIKVIVIK